MQYILNMDFSQIQNSYNTLALKTAHHLAAQLVDEKEQLHPFHTPLEISDFEIAEHQQNFLNKWNQDPAFVKKFRRFSLPLCHKKAEEMVRLSIGLSSSTPLRDFHVKRAVISACLTPLRQTVGSCFATAPAILVQKHHLDLFVDDLYELLMTGRLKRVAEGKEYAVPLCPSPGLMLLKAWEFTLASFCDIKTEFSRWNLAWSLGLDPRQAGGIGAALYLALEEGLQAANQKAEEFHQEVNLAHDSLKMVERLMKQASSEAEVHRLRLEEQARFYHLRSCEEMRYEQQIKAGVYAKFFSFLIEGYQRLFPDYFQEIYDPEMIEIDKGPYEDQRAGFRLVYKHGRADSSLWTLIHDKEAFLQSLVDFLTITEPVLEHSCETEQQKKILSEMTTHLIQHVRSDLFIQTALAKSAKKSRTPWSYVSGGTLEQWMSIYFRHPSLPAKETREVEDAMELFVFLLETLKALPGQVANHLIKDRSQRLLMESPTHVFSLLPGSEFFYQGWMYSGFTYTWIRDHFLIPAQEFYEKRVLSVQEQREICRILAIQEPVIAPMTAAQFCQHFSSEMLPPFLHQMLRAPACIFADTNWTAKYFAFVVSPLTLKLEMWLSDRTGIYAMPLPLINTWFGKGKSYTWTVYTRKV